MASITAERLEQPAEVASKVLRRAQVSKMTRALQSRLALANVKTKHGWENLSIDTLEPKIEMELKRKRPGSSNGAPSDTSSVISDRFSTRLESSPLAAPLFSDHIGRSGGSMPHAKRQRQAQHLQYPGSSNHNRAKVRTSNTPSQSWKSLHRLPESSPAYHRRHSHFPTSSHAPSLSFVSETSTIPDDAPSPVMSEDDDEDLPIHSFQISSNLHSSPPSRSPRTPPPALARSARMRNDAFNHPRNTHNGEDDASLLMFLATSPSPARGGTARNRAAAPSTPPPKSTPLPSSMMSTPGGGPFPGFGLSTPGTQLNFSDFVNMTPSPAQLGGAWARTPIASKTPLAAREARRRLNFDTLLPPTSGSASMGLMDRPRNGKIEGLGMDLGGELVS